MGKSSSEKGRIGEKIAEKYLENKGFCILEKNYKTQFGEIDIIAKDKTYIVFVEVKLRNSNMYGSPREAVNLAKQKNIIKTAMDFISKNDFSYCDFRFDVVEILGNKVEYIENAFW